MKNSSAEFEVLSTYIKLEEVVVQLVIFSGSFNFLNGNCFFIGYRELLSLSCFLKITHCKIIF